MLAPATEAIGFELLGLEFIRAGKHSTLRVYIDSSEGVDVDDCADVSYQVSAVLDIEDPIKSEYNLEVSSPGMDRPLFKPEHYEAVLQQEISVKLQMAVDGRRNFKGQLIKCEQNTFFLEVDKNTYEVSYDNVTKANVVPNFN